MIHNFGRADLVDRDGLARLVTSISRLLEPEQQATLSPEVAAAAGGPEAVEVIDSRRMGGAWTLDQLWDRLGIGAAIRTPDILWRLRRVSGVLGLSPSNIRSDVISASGW